MRAKVISLLILAAILFGCAKTAVKNAENSFIGKEPIIVDHMCTDIERIPEIWIEKTKKTFGISYGHTSHGSQIISGMRALQAKNGILSFSSNTSSRHLTIFDREPKGDLGNPDRRTWYQRTKDLLDHGWGDTNIILWSWCGQVSNATKEDIDTYLELMDALEKEYPKVIFIYMTGHLDGSGEHGNLNIRNTQIRGFCRNNNKILYDFADIESYDPDGNSFLNLNANDRCDYIKEGERRNWADEWCKANPGECSDYRCAHSMPLNCDMKARAFWWLMARLAGWQPE